MSPPVIASAATAALVALLSLIVFFRAGSNLTLQSELQKRNQDIQTQQQEIELQKQQFKAMQDQVNSATQLSKELGPQIIGSMKLVATRSDNKRMVELLKKYGVEISKEDKDKIKALLEEPAKPGATPAPTPAPAK